MNDKSKKQTSQTKTKRTYTKRTKVAFEYTPPKPVVRSVGVKFRETTSYYSNKVYNYLVEGLDIEVGDRVVVLTPSSGLTLVEVVSVSDQPAGTKYVVDKVDLAAHKARTEKAELKAKLMRELAARKSAIDENRILDLYAKEDKMFASILKELRDLG